jgi:hypothetical protein
MAARTLLYNLDKMKDLSVSKFAARLTGFGLFVAFCILCWPLRQRDLEFGIEADFAWQMMERYRLLLENHFSMANLPAPWPHVYMDGQYIVYSLANWLLRWLTETFSSLGPSFPNDLSFALGAALLFNAISYAAACAIFFAAMIRLRTGVILSAILAVSLFLAPQMTAINLVRVDYLNTLPIAVIFYCSCVLAMGEARLRHAVLLGAALAYAANLKINGLFLGIFPVCAAIAVVKRPVKPLLIFVGTSLAAFIVVYRLFAWRLFYYFNLSGIWNHYRKTIDLITPWGSTNESAGPSYYNIALMAGHGSLFIALYLAAAAFTVLRAVQTRNSVALFLSVLFVALSISGILSPLRHLRGGYHMLPVFFAVIGFAAGELYRLHVWAPLKIAVTAAGSIAIASGLFFSWDAYAKVIHRRTAEVAGIDALLRKPANWLSAKLPPNSRVCIQIDSGWTLPPLDGYQIDQKALFLPYLDSSALAKTTPPTVGSLKQACDVVVTSDMHRRMYRDLLQKASVENSKRWDSFFDQLDTTYPAIVFGSNVPVYGYEIRINDLRQ